MPYFPEKHILFIHIPKTGGTTFEYGLAATVNSKKVPLYNHPTVRAYSGKGNCILPEPHLQKVSLQHQTYRTLYQYREILDIPFDDELKIISIVRNPYDRIVSDLFWHQLIDLDSPPNVVFQTIKKYVHQNIYDNHNIPQYQFIIDDSGNLIPKLTLMRTETLDEDLKSCDYETYSRMQVNPDRIKGALHYNHYLNRDSLEWIHHIYKKDFEMFDYSMKRTDQTDVLVFVSDTSDVQELEILAKRFFLLTDVENVFVLSKSAKNVNGWKHSFLAFLPESYLDKVRFCSIRPELFSSDVLRHQWAVDWIQSDSYIILDKEDVLLSPMHSRSKYSVFRRTKSLKILGQSSPTLSNIGFLDVYNTPQMDFVSIVFDHPAEWNLLKIQASSFCFVDPEMVHRIMVLYNEWEDLAIFEKEKIRSYYPSSLQDKVVFLSYTELQLPKEYLNSGWQLQQLCKLWIAKFIDYDYCVLDTKNHFIKPVKISDFFTNDGKYKVFTSPGADTYMQDHFINCLNCFGVKDVSSNIHSVSMSTPFLFDREKVLDMIEHIDIAIGISMPYFFMNHYGITEFYLYAAYLLYRNAQDVAYCPIIHTSIHRNPNEEWSVRFIEEELYLLPQFKVFGIHRDAIPQMSKKYRDSLWKMYKQLYSDVSFSTPILQLIEQFTVEFEKMTKNNI
jgi:Sulfotransferase family/Family of unknown function (DUF6492)